MLELNTPIRIYWDLPAAPAVPSFDHLSLCDELVALQVLMLNLWQPGDEISAGTVQIVERLSKERMAVSLILSPAAIGASLPLLRALKLKSLFVCATAVEELEGVERSAWELPFPVGVSMPLEACGGRDIAGVLAFCLRRGVRELQFPIGRAVAGEELFSLPQGERELLAAVVREVGLSEKLRVTIHDPFVWKVFHSEQEFPEGGCQAANSMLYVAPDGDVFPCPALPFSLGNLSATPLGEIARSQQKKEARGALTRPPAECLLCGALPGCRGGCRGRGYAARLSFDAADAACGLRLRTTSLRGFE